ncbi:phosphodiester glycosidase family protein [Phormidium tenue FACHB-886]|nr:phosphodiester glycosidase family protein [Phormidium tenue FACHB-886]
MVSTRTRRRRRPRPRRFQGTYLAPTASAGRRIFLLVPLVALSIFFIFSKSVVISPSEAALTQPAFLSSAWVPTLAQASVPAPLTQQGAQVVLNGRALNAPWSQRQQKIGIADTGLMRAFGVELLDSNDPAAQPVEWFSDPQRDLLSLSTWLTGQYRYLDITELAQRSGWQVQSNRSTLQISTPPAAITQIRQGRQSWGDRIVIDLDKPTPWQVTEERGAATITIDAKIDPATLRGFVPRKGNRLQGAKVQQSGDRTVIRVSIPTYIRPRVWSLNNPNRLLIDIRPDSLVTRSIAWAPGLRWQQQMVSLGRSQFPVISLEVDSTQPGVELKPIVSNSAEMAGTAPLLSTAQRHQAAAAINGGFFNRNTQLPLGAIRTDERWVSGPILNRGAIAWRKTGEISVGHLSLQETISLGNGQHLPVLSLNSGYVGAGVCRYTPAWGANYKTILDNETLVIVRNRQVVSQRLATRAGQTTVPIPADGYLLVVRADREAARALATGATIQVEAATQPGDFDQFAEIMGGGPLLLRDRQIVLNAQAEKFSNAFIQQSAPRSVIASTATGSLALVTLHERVDGLGPTLAEAAKIIQQMGFVNALNLDGGSSTTLYLGGQILDRPASTAARVHNGIGVFLQPGS